MKLFSAFVIVFLLLPCAVSFLNCQNVGLNRHSTFSMSAASERTATADGKEATTIDSSVASKFKILTCSSTSCTKKRKESGLDELATFSALFGRIQSSSFPSVEIEEAPCLGACAKSPCVAIEHEDYVGTVALEGMNGNEFTDRVFHNIIEEDDIGRVWECVENAIHQMAEEHDDDDDDDDNEEEFEYETSGVYI